MKDGIFSVTIGNMDAWIIRDGTFNYPAPHFFAHASPDVLEEASGKYELSARQVRTPYHVLYLETGSERILVDTGAGPLGAHAGEIFPDVDHATTETGQLADRLEAIGTAPSEIDTVILTHAHPDHVGGILTADGELLFGEAEYCISETEWKFWFSEEAEEEAPPGMTETARRNLGAIEDRVALFDAGTDLRSGIRTIGAPGHTPGHVAVAISSEDEQLVHMADLVLHPLLMEHSDWETGFDLDPEEAARSRELILSQLAGVKTPVLGYHFPPSPGLGYVEQQETGWGWRPLESGS